MIALPVVHVGSKNQTNIRTFPISSLSRLYVVARSPKCGLKKKFSLSNLCSPFKIYFFVIWFIENENYLKKQHLDFSKGGRGYLGLN